MVPLQGVNSPFSLPSRVKNWHPLEGAGIITFLQDFFVSEVFRDLYESTKVKTWSLNDSLGAVGD